MLANTTVVVLGDNGTASLVTTHVDRTRQKDTLYQGGIHVPMIVAGPLVSVPGRTIDKLVGAVDLFATVADIAGATLDPAVVIDSTSLVPLLVDSAAGPVRDTIYAESFGPVGPAPWSFWTRAIRDERYKLIHYGDHDEFYDMQGVDIEGTDLIAVGLTAEQDIAYQALSAALPL